MSAIVLAGRGREFEERVRGAFNGELNGDLTTWEQGLEPAEAIRTVDGIAGLGPDMVALGPGLNEAEWSRLAQEFDRLHPEISVVLVAQPSARMWEAALRSGVRDVVAPDADDDDLRAVFERALGTAVRRRANLLGEPLARPLGQVIAVLGPKGGVGKTTLATNLAVGLASAAPREVVLVDVDLQFGDVSHALRVTPTYTMADALRARADEDATALKAFLTPHSSGLYVLCAPDSPADVDEMEAERVAAVVRSLGEAFRYVVVDTGSGLDEFTLAAAEVATDFLMVGVTDVPSVTSMRKELETFDRIGMTTQPRHFVLNRSDRPVGLSVADIEQTVGLPVTVAIPSSIVVTVSVNQGTPLLATNEPSPPHDAMARLVQQFAAVPAVAAKGKFAKKKGKVR